jgi:hypothetical protein
MKLIPFLLGAIALVLAFLAGMFFCVRRKMRRNFARMEATTIFRAPGRINLKRLEPFKWDKVERAEQRIAAFRALGFAEVCGFTLGGMPTSRLFLLQHPVTGQIGIVQERDSVGTWSDAAFFDGDTSQPIYVSSVLNKAHFFLFPGDPKIHLPAATEAELLAAVGKAVANGTRSVRRWEISRSVGCSKKNAPSVPGRDPRRNFNASRNKSRGPSRMNCGSPVATNFSAKARSPPANGSRPKRSCSSCMIRRRCMNLELAWMRWCSVCLN